MLVLLAFYHSMNPMSVPGFQSFRNLYRIQCRLIIPRFSGFAQELFSREPEPGFHKSHLQLFRSIRAQAQKVIHYLANPVFIHCKTTVKHFSYENRVANDTFSLSSRRECILFLFFFHLLLYRLRLDFIHTLIMHLNSDTAKRRTNRPANSFTFQSINLLETNESKCNGERVYKYNAR